MEKITRLTLLLVSSFMILLIIDGINIAYYSMDCEKLKDSSSIQKCKYDNMPIMYKVLMIIGIVGGLFSMQLPVFFNMDNSKRKNLREDAQ